MALQGRFAMKAGWAAVVLLLASALFGLPWAQAQRAGSEPGTSPGLNEPPVVIGHRGASGYRPEHTLPAYNLAIDMGAEIIEPDLVMTKDGEFIVRHENNIAETTDVADHPEFADRETTKTIDGVEQTGWFTEDFTLRELKTLRAIERLPDLRPLNTVFDGQYRLVTLQEVIDLAQRRGVGVFPEMKHPTYFASIGLPMPDQLVAQLHANGYRGRNSPALIQSFEVGVLQRVRELSQLPTFLAISSNLDSRPPDFVESGDPRTWRELISPEGLADLAEFLDGIGPSKDLIVPRTDAGVLLEPTSLVDDAHDAGLLVYAYTFRRENAFLPANYRRGNPDAELYEAAPGSAPAEYALFYSLGVDGVWSDNPDIAVAAREKFMEVGPGERPGIAPQSTKP
ncbi:MAG: glycerophosphodiester phosphodiesterase [Egibacteraceae bacterium]